MSLRNSKPYGLGLWTMASQRDRLVVGGPPLVEILNGVHYLDCSRFHPMHRFTMKAHLNMSGPHPLGHRFSNRSELC